MKINNVKKLKEILTADDVVKSINYNLDYLCSIIPQIRDMQLWDHKHPHHNDTVWEHTLKALSLSPIDFDVRLALLIHDIGTLFLFFEGDDGVRHFWGHAEKSAEIAKTVLKSIGFDDNYTEYISTLSRLHDEKITQENINKNRAFYEVLFQIQICDALAHNPEHNQKRIAYIESVKQLFNK